ncbi:MAG: bifunctional DNA-formamidopyrimidine glycosylase/DNA-(apurinic or apyrimidinic site) lyase [Proteobacteria bacterium]|jgi:formamidopyrimidine-DNA glycosylase|nr:bifunctional DNA-formamidopyrimidine glycosylase/DNA-(apurinic or apyrimidinic site) lyase [Pseudomonadota bacterium]
MPELPEVETVRRELEQIFLQDPVIEKVSYRRKDLREVMPLSLLLVRKLKITRVLRRAKYLILTTANHGALISHLGMTGTWRSVPVGSDLGPHDHVVLERKRDWLVFRDPRRFGIFDWAEAGDWEDQVRFRHLGPEPLSAGFTPEYLFQELKKRKTAVKVALMDQALVVGVGNIYASEILFRAGVKPGLSSRKVSLAKCVQIVEKTQEILSQAITLGGSSMSDFYGVSGVEGSFQNQHSVYDRSGEPCVICATRIRVRVMGGRSTYWCPQCQK